MQNVFEEVGRELVNLLTKKGYLDHRVKRDLEMREEFITLKKQGKSKEEALKILSDKPYCHPNGDRYYIGQKAVEKIVYRKAFIQPKKKKRK